MNKMFLSFILFTHIITIHAEVNESSGNMYLSKRLFTVAGNNVELPINLNYSAGIGVDQRASWVGLGFDISLPYIERIPQGCADEKDGIFECNGSPGYGEYWFYSQKTYDKLITETTNGYMESPPKGNFTNQQDYYYLSAHFANGRILFGQPATNSEPLVAYLQNWRPLKIKYKINDDDDIYKWEVIDENGVKYTFGGTQGVLKVRADITKSSDNTSISMSTVDATWEKTVITKTGCIGPDCSPEVKVISADHYVNATFNRRWYLTKIESITGEVINLTYTLPGSPVKLADFFYNAPASDKAATSLFDFFANGHEFTTFGFGFDNYYIFPVYPVDIISQKGKAHFTFGNTNTPDILTQGNKRIDFVEVYNKHQGSFNLSYKLKMTYDPQGLSPGHPFSSGGKGRLQLIGVERLSSDGSKSLPVISFEYTSNPQVNFYRHDFFGYYRNQELRRVTNGLQYPVGQSTVGTPAIPGSEAWSVNKVTYGTGAIEEYEYEENVATLSSTNITFVSNRYPKLNPGFRVKTKRVYDGITSVPIITEYNYGEGYIGHRSSIAGDLSLLYSTLNAGENIEIANIMVLSGTGVQYSYCKSTTENGSVVSYFLMPGDVLEKYEVTPVENLLLRDVEVPASKGLNNLAHCRGAEYKTEYYRAGTNTNPVTVSKNDYWVKYDMYQYETQETEMNALTTCETGISGSSAPVVTADNQKERDYVGFIRLKSVTQTKNNVVSTSEILRYNDVNGLPEITRSSGTMSKLKLKKTDYAFENPKYSSALGPNGAHMLTLPCQTINYEKQSLDNTTQPQPEEIRTAQSTTWSNSLGTSAWVPYKTYLWKADYNLDGTPDVVFADFIYDDGANNLNWQLVLTNNRYNFAGKLIESINAAGSYSTSIYSEDNTLPLVSVTNSRYGECLYTDWAEKEPVTNIANKIMSTSPDHLHFAPRSLVLSTNLSNTGGDQYAVTPPTSDNQKLSALSGKAYLIQFWAKAEGMAGSSVKSFIHLQAIPSYNWSSYIYIDLTSVWKLYEIKVVFPENTSDHRYRLVLRPPRNQGAEYVEGTIYYDDIRVTPIGGLAITTYYDQKWHSPILSLDANNQPGNLSENDEFGRKIRINKLYGKYGQNIPSSIQKTNSRF